jgi:ATP-dependent DNA helicase RecQ
MAGPAGHDGRPARCTLLYDPADRKLQRFFQGGRTAREDDLVNAHAALNCCAGRPALPTLADVEAVSPLPRSRLRSCLAILTARGLVRREQRNRYRLLRPDLTREELTRICQTYRDHADRELLKVQEMVAYAEGHSCRWKALLDYFGSEELSEGQCGHCDRCAPAKVMPFLAPGESGDLAPSCCVAVP